MSNRNVIQIGVVGRRAMWSIPQLRGEPHSYAVPTPSGLKGLLRALYWKPGFEWEIRRYWIRTPVKYETFVQKALINGNVDRAAERTLRTVTVLRDVEYVIEAEIRCNAGMDHKGVAEYTGEAYQRIAAGQCWRSPCFGWREFRADVSWASRDVREWDNEAGPSGPIGPLLFDLIPQDIDKNKYDPVFFFAHANRGCVEVPRALYDTHRPAIEAARIKVHAPRSTPRKGRGK